MPPLPAPLTMPDAFLAALGARPDPLAAARDAGCAVHSLSATGADPALHAAGARALAASLARDGAPLLLACTPLADAPGYAATLSQGLMGYERIHCHIATDLALILILPPTGTNSFWGRPG